MQKFTLVHKAIPYVEYVIATLEDGEELEIGGMTSFDKGHVVARISPQEDSVTEYDYNSHLFMEKVAALNSQGWVTKVA